MQERVSAGAIITISFVLMIMIGTGGGALMLLQQLQLAKGYKWIAPLVQVATSGNKVYVVWDSNKTSTLKEILFRASTDNGKSFSDKINLSHSPKGLSELANIAASGNDVYVVWGDNKTGNTEIYFTKSTYDGKTFGNPIQLNSSGTGSQKAVIKMYMTGYFELVRTLVAASGKNVYVTWWDNKTGNWDIMFARSTDGGYTFQKTVNLSNSPNELSEKVAMAVNGNNLYFAWWETAKNGTIGPVFRASHDNGTTFDPILRLSANGPIGG
jgi:hypothetical protein